MRGDAQRTVYEVMSVMAGVKTAKEIVKMVRQRHPDVTQGGASGAISNVARAMEELGMIRADRTIKPYRYESIFMGDVE